MRIEETLFSMLKTSAPIADWDASDGDGTRADEEGDDPPFL